jgi:sn-glycerol 3-phosphate transport system substrate-binding protein
MKHQPADRDVVVRTDERKKHVSRVTSTRAVAILAATSATMGLAACGPSTTASGGESGAAAQTDYSSVEPATEISFWGNHPGNSVDFETQVAQKFAEDTGITVDIVSAGSNYDEVAQKFQTAQVGGDAGDLVVVSDGTWFSAYLNGSITAVDSIFSSADLDATSYYPSLYDDYLYQDAHYAVPYARSLLVYMYNKDNFEKAGLGDAAPATWDEVKEYSEKLAAADTGAIPFTWASDTSYASWSMTSLLWANGADWSDGWDFSPMTSEATVSALQFAQDSITDGWAQVLSGDPSTVFGAGSVSQMINSSGGIGAIRDAAQFDVGVGVLPTGSSGDEDIVPSGGAGLAINANSSPEKQLAAAMFASYLTNAENTVAFSELTGYVPVRSDADTTALTADNPLFQPVIDSLDRTRSQSYARVLVPGGATALDSGLMDILVDKADVAETLNSMQSEIQSSYDTNVKSSQG